MRLINADKLMEVVMTTYLKEIDIDSPIEGMSIVLDRIYNAPTVDAVQVVRCGKCKYYDEKDHNCLDEMAYARCWMPTDFCSFGERNDNEVG